VLARRARHRGGGHASLCPPYDFWFTQPAAPMSAATCGAWPARRPGYRFAHPGYTHHHSPWYPPRVQL